MTNSSMRCPRGCGLLTRDWPESATHRIGIACQPLRTGDGYSYPSAGRLGHAEGMESVATAHLIRSREFHLASRWEEACAEYAEAAQVCARGDEAVALLHRVFDLRVEADECDAVSYTH